MGKLIKNPQYNKFILPKGYRDIGWQVDINNFYKKKCVDNGHSIQNGQLTEFDNSLYLWRCTDIITSCCICKIVNHTDMSD